MNKKQVYDFIDKNETVFCDVSDKVWDYAETAFDEFQSMDTICEALEKYGFAVEKGVGNVPTAFVGTYGSGYPVIGMLGEYDGLSGLSQVAGATEEKPIVAGANGHGCGHNVLGAGSLAAAVGVAEYLKQSGKSGTVKYFGCPGEEGGSGKAFMAREGVFDGVDIAFCWHPGGTNGAQDITTLANYQVLYKFTGRSSHAAAAPEHGRSALDALELMNTGVQYLREHVVQEARIHYAITNTGGYSPNVVQAKAEVLYLIRAPKVYQVEEIYQRINKIAHGMAMATETEVEIDFVKACSDIVPNKMLTGILHHNMEEIGAPKFSDEEIAFAKALEAPLTSAFALVGSNLPDSARRDIEKQYENKVLFDGILPFYPDRDCPIAAGSSDVGDVSWNVPTAQVGTTCWTLRSPPHTWQIVTIGRSSIAHKGLIYAGKSLAGAAIDAIENDQIIQDAKAELADRLGGRSYTCPIPKEVQPRAIGKL